MRISELFVDGFGHFHNYTVGPLRSPLVIFYGRNEAGKSTLLAFIRTILFGFPARNRQQYFPPMNGGRHGGRLTVLDDAGDSYTIERQVGSGPGPVTMIDASGAHLPETRLQALLGSTSSDVFKNVFAFSLSELQNGNVLSDANVNAQVYSVGLGATRLPDAVKSLQAKRVKIYLPSGRKQVVADLVSQLREVDEKMAEIRSNVDHYATLVADRERLTTAIEVRDGEVRSLETDRRELRRITDAWDDWIALVEAEGQIERLPHFEAFPSDAISRLEKIEVRVRGAEEELEEAAASLARAREFAKAPVDDEAMAEDSDSVSDINRGRSAFDMSIRDLPDRQAELAGMEKSLQERLRNLGLSWDEKRLESFDISMPVRDDIEHFQREISHKQETVNHDSNLATQEERRLSEAVELSRGAEDAFSKADEPGLDQAHIDRRRTILKSSRTKFDELERKRDSHSNLKVQLETRPVSSTKSRPFRLSSRVIFGLVMVALGIAFIVTGLVSETPLSGRIGTLSGLVLIAIGATVLSGRERKGADSEDVGDPFAERVSTALKEQHIAEEEFSELAKSLALDGLDAVGLDEAETQLDRAERTLTAWTYLNDTHKEAISSVERREKTLEEAAGRVEISEAALTVVEDEWKAWLTGRDLPDTFIPETMIEFRVNVENALLELRRVKEMRHRVEAIEEDIRQYTSRVDPLAAKYTVLPDSANVAAKADSLIARHSAARDKINLRKRAEEEAVQAEEVYERYAARSKKASADLTELMSLAAAEDPETFRTMADQDESRRELTRRADDHITRLQRLSGPGAALVEFRKKLSGTDLQSVAEEEHRVSEELTALNENVIELREERARAELQIENISSEEESSRLRIERSSLLEELNEQAREWSKLRLAEELLRRARDKFQKERQPEVVRHAKSFFTTVTAGRYKDLYAPIGEQTINVVDWNGTVKEPRQLSEGARNQLHLAVSFGFIRELRERTESLPVIVDEILVNFDPDRAQRAAEAFANLSETNQVLVFTCHPTMVETFKAASPGAQVIDLEATETQYSMPLS